MNKIILIIFLALASLVSAQNTKDDAASLIELTPYVGEQVEGLTDIARNNLENKLAQIVTANGMGVSAGDSRFIITANIVVLTKNITPTAPPMQAYTLELNLYIGDGIEGTKFSTHSVTLKGVGENETKAYMAALRNLKTNDPQYQVFISKAKSKIVAYYNARCDAIIAEAKGFAAKGNYDAALYKLSSIPVASKECYNKTIPITKMIYKQQIDKECKTYLANAKSSWIGNQDEYGATNASEYLALIDPNASCYKEAQAFTNQIGAKIRADEQREWNFRMKVYQDEVASEKAALQVARDISLAYAKSENVYYTVVGWW